MSMFLAKTTGRELVTVRALGAITPDPRCRWSDKHRRARTHSGECGV